MAAEEIDADDLALFEKFRIEDCRAQVCHCRHDYPCLLGKLRSQ